MNVQNIQAKLKQLGSKEKAKILHKAETTGEQRKGQNSPTILQDGPWRIW
jgi:hypothetical protein